jgi:hypothetical protein
MFTEDSCSLCDHVPHRLERACRAECGHDVVADDLSHIMPLVLV